MPARSAFGRRGNWGWRIGFCRTPANEHGGYGGVMTDLCCDGARAVERAACCDPCVRLPPDHHRCTLQEWPSPATRAAMDSISTLAATLAFKIACSSTARPLWWIVSIASTDVGKGASTYEGWNAWTTLN